MLNKTLHFATILHDSFCAEKHENKCICDWDLESNWSAPIHKEWFERAQKLIPLLDETPYKE